MKIINLIPAIVLSSLMIAFISMLMISDSSSLSDAGIIDRNFSNMNINNKSCSIILAIDGSNSQDDNTLLSKKNSIQKFIDTISNSNSDIKIGLVVWNTKLNKSLSLSLTDDFKIVKEHVKLINAQGNTCLKVGLESAKSMMNEADKNDKRYIIYISDGIEHYCNNSVNICSIAEEIRKSQITIFTIGNRDSAGNLSCISGSSNLFDLNVVSFDKALQDIAKYIIDAPPMEVINSDSNNMKKTDIITINPIFNEFSLKAEVDNITIEQSSTNVSVSKTIIAGPKGPRVVIKITTPKPRYLNKEILFSIDSSGSVGLKEYEKEINESLDKVLDYLNNREKGEHINISILSWDNDIDFAYGNISNGKNAGTARFIPVQQAIHDRPLLMNNFTCDENEITRFDIGLNEAFKVFNNNTIYPNSIPIMFLIVGGGEFEPWTKQNFSENVSLFTMGLDVKKSSKMELELKNIATLGPDGYDNTQKTAVVGTFEKFYKRIFGDDGDLGDKMIKLLNKGFNKTILYDLKLSDNINPFLELDPDSIRVNGISTGFTKKINNNSSIFIEMPANLAPGNEIEIYYDTKMNLTLPSSEMLDNKIMTKKFMEEGRSGLFVQYNWQDGKQYEVKLPTNYIRIFS